MNFFKNNVVSVMYLFLLSTLFMPWILVPDPVTLTVLPVTGFRFLSDNFLMLILIFLIIFTYVFGLLLNFFVVGSFVPHSEDTLGFWGYLFFIALAIALS